MTPAQWRHANDLTQAEAAARIGITGKNPARTWHRYETGERSPSAATIAKIDELSGGGVNAAGWAAARVSFIERASRSIQHHAAGSSDGDVICSERLQGVDLASPEIPDRTPAPGGDVVVGSAPIPQPADTD